MRLRRGLRNSFLSPTFLLGFFFALLLPSFKPLTLAFLATTPLLLFAPLLCLCSGSCGSCALFLSNLVLALACLSRLLLCPLSCSALFRLTLRSAIVRFLFSFTVLWR
jgi:hypothetical protein